jgi:FkbM family methyltransferase
MNTIVYKNIILHIPDRYYHKNLTNRFENNTYEKEELYLSHKYLNKNDNVLELGSCLGVIASSLSNICNNVISIEANPELKDALQLTKKHNKLDNVTFLSGYLDIEERIVEFQTYDNIVAGSGDREDLEINNVRGWGHTLKKYNVHTILLNKINNYTEINCLVIDIEGGELDFLQKFKDFILVNINKLCIELHGHLMKDKLFNRKCLTLLNEMGFKLKDRLGISYYFEK